MTIMRTAFVLLLAGICALALATPVQKTYYKIADKVYLTKQKDILQLFNYVNQPSYYPNFIKIARTFQFKGQWDQWTKPEYAEEFYHYYQHDILPQGEVFSVFYSEHLKQAVALFRTFYYAKDYETFFKAAVWARQNVNEGMFIYALSVAVIHSKHTRGIILPPIHEIFPHFFFNDEVIYKAQQYKQHYWGNYENEDSTYKGYTIHANYSSWHMNVHPEQSMTYFTEDIGINSFYYYRHITAPFWMPSEEFYYNCHEYRGEKHLWYMNQLLSRYYMERLSNGMGEIPHFEYEYPIETGYYPSLHYPNGLHFPIRPNHANLYYQGVHGKLDYGFYGNHTYTYTYVKDYERRLRDALDTGYIYSAEGKVINLFDKNGLNTLGLLVQSNADSPNGRLYGDLLTFASHLLGYSYYPLDQYKVVPSALEQFETSLRDPIFYQMYKRIMHYFYQHQNYEGPYEKDQLYWDTVEVKNIEVDRLMTYFDYHYSDLSNAVVVDEEEFLKNDFEIHARQYRLNHKPFNYKVHVESKTPCEAFVKVFIGPKYDEYGREISIKDNYKNFYELERFHYTLQAGKNVIERNSQDNVLYVRDRSTYMELYQQVLTALKGEEDFKYYYPHHYYGFPQRYMLPKGDFGGKTYQLFVFVSPYHSQTKKDMANYYRVDSEYSFGYPLDRPIEFEYEFLVQNSYFKDVVIYHKNTEEEFNTIWSKH